MSEEISIPLMQIATENWENTPVSIKALVLEMTQSIEQLKEQIAQLRSSSESKPREFVTSTVASGREGIQGQSQSEEWEETGCSIRT